MREMKNGRPQVLLLGNGINLLCNESTKWEDLIQKVWKNSEVMPNDNLVKNMPFPLKVILGTNDHVDEAVKQDSVQEMTIENALCREYYEKILSFGFDDILTTNYSYELESIADSKILMNIRRVQKLQRHDPEISKAENKYCLQTYNAVEVKEGKNRIWHIHGELRKPSGIILGHDYYSRLLARYITFLEKRGNDQFIYQKEGKTPILKSWLDSFIMGDVYVLGFGFDMSELDLWWLLSRKKREKALHGNVYFYEPSSNQSAKQLLLGSLGVEVRNLGYSDSMMQGTYESFYRDALEDIREQMME